MNMDEAYRKALDMERRREKSKRKSGQGAFYSDVVHIDGWLEDSDNPDKLEPYSDHGDGVRRLVAGLDEGERARHFKKVFERLSPEDRRFANAVLSGKTWQDMGYADRTGLFYRLNRLIAKILEIQKDGNFDSFYNL